MIIMTSDEVLKVRRFEHILMFVLCSSIASLTQIQRYQLNELFFAISIAYLIVSSSTRLFASMSNLSTLEHLAIARQRCEFQINWTILKSIMTIASARDATNERERKAKVEQLKRKSFLSRSIANSIVWFKCSLLFVAYSLFDNRSRCNISSICRSIEWSCVCDASTLFYRFKFVITFKTKVIDWRKSR